MKSERVVEVVRIGEVIDHPNADRLEITYVHGGYPVIIRKGQFAEGDLAVYIPVDMTLPEDDPTFAFLELKSRKRLRAKKLRGVFSMGLLIEAPVGKVEGDDVTEYFKISPWEPKPQKASLGSRGFSSSPSCKGPAYTKFPSFSLDALRKCPHALQEGEEVILTEKLHGTLHRSLFAEGRLWVGSRNQVRHRAWDRERVSAVSVIIVYLCAWIISKFPKTRRILFLRKQAAKLREVNCVWWAMALRLGLEEKLSRFPGHVFFAEVYGPSIQDLSYGLSEPGYKLYAIQNVDTENFLSDSDFQYVAESLGLDTVPTLFRGAWREDLKELAEGKSTIEGSDHVREGFVVRKKNDVLGLFYKYHGQGYLLRK